MRHLTYLILFLIISSSIPARAQYIDSGLTTPLPSDSSIDQVSCNAPVHGTEILYGSGPVEPLFASWSSHRAFRVTGGHEFDWLQPRLSNNVSVVLSGPLRNCAKSFDHSFEPTSRVWVGIENARCNGIRAGYWYLDTRAPKQVNFASATDPLSLTIEGAGGNFSRTAYANAGDAMTSDHHLQMRTIDLEGTHRMRFSCTDALATFGLRYAKTHQRVHAVATDGTGALTELVCQDLDFEGFGPTVSLELMRGLFAKDSFFCGLSCFADTRWSMLMGTQEQEIVLVTGGGPVVVVDQHDQDDFLPIGHLAGGLQWAGRPFGPGIWTIRTGYRAEAWFGTGGPVDAHSNLGLHGMLLSIAGTW